MFRCPKCNNQMTHPRTKACPGCGWQTALRDEWPLLNAISRTLTITAHSDLFRSCLSCEHFEVHTTYGQAGERVESTFCMKHQRYPPPQIVVDGCNDFANQDDIPF